MTTTASHRSRLSFIYCMDASGYLSRPTEKGESHMQGHRDGPRPIPFLHPLRSLTQENRLIPVPVRIPPFASPLREKSASGEPLPMTRAAPHCAQRWALLRPHLHGKGHRGCETKGRGAPAAVRPIPPFVKGRGCAPSRATRLVTSLTVYDNVYR